MKKNLNGWQRLWVVASLAMLLIMFLNGAFSNMPSDASEERMFVFNILLGWLFMAGFIYGLGWSIAWVIRGFRK
jgi:hypothetical protein